MRYTLKIYKNKFDVSRVVELYRVIRSSYNSLLYINGEVLNGNIKNKESLIKSTMREINKVLQEYHKQKVEINKSLNKFAQYIEKTMKKNEKYGIQKIKYRIKEPSSLIEKMFRYSFKVEEGKMPWISDILGFRIIVDNENCCHIIKKKINEIIKNHPSLSYYIDSDIISPTKNMNNNEILFEYKGEIIKWRGGVIENLINLNQTYIHVLSTISPHNYTQLKEEFKKMAKHKKTNAENFIKYKLKNEILKKELRTKEFYISYDIEKGMLYLIFPEEPSTCYSVKEYFINIKKNMDITKKIINQKKDNPYYTLLENYRILRPHYGLEKIEIPFLFNKIGLKTKKYDPWDSFPPLIIHKGCEAGFHSTKIAYLVNKYEAIPIIEIQILGKEQNTMFEKSPQYNHKDYKIREIKKTEKSIIQLINYAIKKGAFTKNQGKKFIKEIKKEYLRITKEMP